MYEDVQIYFSKEKHTVFRPTINVSGLQMIESCILGFSVLRTGYGCDMDWTGAAQGYLRPGMMRFFLPHAEYNQSFPDDRESDLQVPLTRLSRTVVTSRDLLGGCGVEEPLKLT